MRSGGVVHRLGRDPSDVSQAAQVEGHLGKRLLGCLFSTDIFVICVLMVINISGYFVNGLWMNNESLNACYLQN